MTTKLTNDGILYNDGSLQNTAVTTGVPSANWTELGAGLILQWGPVSLPTGYNTSQSVTYPIPFPNACLTAWTSVDYAAANMLGVSLLTTTSLRVGKGIGDSDFRTGTWFALGY